MRILIANIELLTRTGSVTVVRDLARNLASRGHEVIAYAPAVGEVGRGFAADRVTVVDDLDEVAGVPDVIHGHHNLPTVLALARFPGCPAIWWSHGLNDWFDRPHPFDRIGRYLAIDTPRQRMLAGILAREPGDIEILPNGVDLTRIPERPQPLPAAPKRALLFAKWATAPHAAMLMATCRRLGLAFGAIGRSVGRLTSQPERDLVESDIVFATGRSALEALCAGAAVVVGDYRGLAGMVTSANFKAQRAINFGHAGLIQQMTAPNLERAIRHYDAVDAMAVSRTARESADFSKLTERLVSIYSRVVAEQTEKAWTENDTRSVDVFLNRWPAQPERAPPGVDWEGLKAKLQRWRDHNAAGG